VWRAGAAYDLTGTGRTALKASYSRYALQVGIDRVTSVNPLSNGSRTCPWSDPNGDGIFQESEVNTAQCGAFSGGVGFSYADGIAWPYSDEVTAGVETQLPGAVRVGAMFYYRTNRDQIGQRNVAVPTSAYTPFTGNVPNSPGGTVGRPVPTTVTVDTLARARVSADGTGRAPIGRSQGQESWPSASPDAEFVVYIGTERADEETLRHRLLLRRFDGSGSRVLFLDGEAEYPVW
jgi:hypothetical protein